jgi:hypothetical protein
MIIIGKAVQLPSIRLIKNHANLPQGNVFMFDY